MKILVINAGSSSLKYQLMDSENGEVIAKGLCERIGMKGSKLTFKATGKSKLELKRDMQDHNDAIDMVIHALTEPELGVIKNLNEIDAVGHRVVHGGELFKDSVKIDEEVISEIELLNSLAPLHNPANLMGIRACQKMMPGVPMVAVFDTAFHQTMPPKAFLYDIPYEAYEKYMVRRYGFHGTSHLYVSKRAAQKLEKEGIPTEKSKIITCHLGNGSSITAVQGGKSVETSMGFTPLAGLPMGTRSGNIDPAIVTYLMDKMSITGKSMDNYLNKKSGMLGISGVSSDFRDLDEAAEKGNKRAELALQCFSHAVKKYIGAYAAIMNGVDAIVFTAGVGENDRATRARILQDMEFLGVDVDFEYNDTCPRGEEVELSKPGSKVKVYVIPTDEEMVIAQDTARLAK